MLAPIAAVLLAVGTFNTPAMVAAEQDYLKQHPGIEVQDIQVSRVDAAAPRGSERGW